MNTHQYINLIKTVNRFNEICNNKSIPCHASIKNIWLDYGAGWKDESIVIRFLNRTNTSCTSFQINLSDRDLIINDNIDLALNNILNYNLINP